MIFQYPPEEVFYCNYYLDRAKDAIDSSRSPIFFKVRFAINALVNYGANSPKSLPPPLSTRYRVLEDYKKAEVGVSQEVLDAIKVWDPVTKTLSYPLAKFVTWWASLFAVDSKNLIPTIPPDLLRAFYITAKGAVSTKWLVDRFDAGFSDFRYFTGQQLNQLGDDFTKFAQSLVEMKGAAPSSSDRNYLMLDLVKNPPAWVHELNKSQISSLLNYHSLVRAIQYADTTNEPHSSSNWRLSAKFINFLTPDGVSGIPVNSFLNVDLSQLLPTILSGVTKEQIQVALPGSVTKLTAEQIQAINPSSWGSNFSDFCKTLTGSQIESLTNSQISWLWRGNAFPSYLVGKWNTFSQEQQEAILFGHWSVIPAAIVNRLPSTTAGKSMLALLDPNSINAVPTTTLNSYSSEVWASMSIWAIRSISAETTSMLTGAIRDLVWARLASDSWWSLTGDQIRAWKNGSPTIETTGQGSATQQITDPNLLDQATSVKLPRWSGEAGLLNSARASEISLIALRAEFSRASASYAPANARIYLNLTREQYRYLQAQGILQQAIGVNASLRSLLPPILARTAWQISQLTGAEALMLDPETIACLTSQQIAAIPAGILALLSQEQLMAFDPLELVSLDSLQIKKFSDLAKFPQLLQVPYSDFLTTAVASQTMDNMAQGYTGAIKSLEIFANRTPLSLGSLYQRSGQAWRESYRYSFVRAPQGANFEGDVIKNMEGYFKSLPNTGRVARLILNTIGSYSVAAGYFMRAARAGSSFDKAFEAARGLETLASAIRVPMDLLAIWYFQSSSKAMDRLYPNLMQAREWIAKSTIDANGKVAVPENSTWFKWLRQTVGDKALLAPGTVEKDLSKDYKFLMGSRLYKPWSLSEKRANRWAMAPGFLQDAMLVGISVMTFVKIGRENEDPLTEAAAGLNGVGALLNSLSFLQADYFLTVYGKAPFVKGNPTASPYTAPNNANSLAGVTIVLAAAFSITSEIMRSASQLQRAQTDSERAGAIAYLTSSVVIGAAQLAFASMMVLSTGVMGVVGLIASLLMPNPQAIGRAAQVYALIKDYEATGRRTIAEVLLWPLYNNAALDAVPFINFWSLAYTESARSIIWNSITPTLMLTMLQEQQRYRETTSEGFIALLKKSVGDALERESVAQGSLGRFSSERVIVGSAHNMRDFLLDAKPGVSLPLVDSDGSVNNYFPYVSGFFVDRNMQSANDVREDAFSWAIRDNYNSSTDFSYYAKITLTATEDFIRLGKRYEVDASMVGMYTNTAYLIQTSAVTVKMGGGQLNTYTINYDNILPSSIMGVVARRLPRLVPMEGAALANLRNALGDQSYDPRDHNLVMLAGLPGIDKQTEAIDIDNIASGTTVYGDPMGGWLKSWVDGVSYVSSKDARDKLDFVKGNVRATVNGMGTAVTANSGHNVIEVALKWRDGARDTNSTFNANALGLSYAGDNNENMLTFRPASSSIRIELDATQSYSVNGAIYKYRAAVFSEKSKRFVFAANGDMLEGADDAYFKSFDRIMGGNHGTDWHLKQVNSSFSTAQAAQFKDVSILDFMPAVNNATISQSKFLTINAHGNQQSAGVNSVNIQNSAGFSYNSLGSTNIINLQDAKDIVFHMGCMRSDALFDDPERVLPSQDTVKISGEATVKAWVGAGIHSFELLPTPGPSPLYQLAGRISLDVHASTGANAVTIVKTADAQSTRIMLDRGDSDETERDLWFGLGPDGVHLWLESESIEFILQGPQYSGVTAGAYGSYASFLSETAQGPAGAGLGSVKIYESGLAGDVDKNTPYFTVSQLVALYDDAMNFGWTSKVGENNHVTYFNVQDVRNKALGANASLEAWRVTRLPDNYSVYNVNITSGGPVAGTAWRFPS